MHLLIFLFFIFIYLFIFFLFIYFIQTIDCGVFKVYIRIVYIALEIEGNQFEFLVQKLSLGFPFD